MKEISYVCRYRLKEMCDDWIKQKRQQLRKQLIDDCIQKWKEVTTTATWHEKYGIGDRRDHMLGPPLTQWLLEKGYTVDKEFSKKYLN